MFYFKAFRFTQNMHYCRFKHSKAVIFFIVFTVILLGGINYDEYKWKFITGYRETSTQEIPI